MKAGYFSVLAGVVSVAACGACVSLKPHLSVDLSESGPAPDVVSSGSGDEHWFESDDFVFSRDPLADRSYVYVKLAKLRQKASEGTKGEAKFFDVNDAKEVWSAYFWTTRPAQAPDLKIGAVVICFEGNKDGDGVYQPPQDRDSARSGSWWMAKITDVSELYKERVRVSTYECAPRALRVPI